MKVSSTGPTVGLTEGGLGVPIGEGTVRMGFPSSRSVMSWLSKQAVVPPGAGGAQEQVSAEADMSQPGLDASHRTSMADLTWDASTLLLAEAMAPSVPALSLEHPQVLVCILNQTR